MIIFSCAGRRSEHYRYCRRLGEKGSDTNQYRYRWYPPKEMRGSTSLVVLLLGNALADFDNFPVKSINLVAAATPTTHQRQS